MAKRGPSAASDISADGGQPIQAAFQAAIKRATLDLKGLATLLGALAAVAVAYYAFEDRLKLHEPWPAAICGGAMLAFFLLFLLPELLEQLKLQRLRINGIHGRISNPKYFRISPYEADDAQVFTRPDAAVADVRRWIEASSYPILYLSGQSGVGKSSLINAALVPSMTGARWAVLTLRSHDSPLNETTAALLQPSAVWRRPPAAPLSLRNLIEQAGERLQKDGKRLLIVIDQFEEALILSSKEDKEELSTLLCGLAAQPVAGVKVLLSVRAEYLNDLPGLGLQAPAFGSRENAFEVRPFSRADAEAFIQKSGLDLAPGLLEKVLEEASEIEDMPDRVRPIVLNMFGLAVAPFSGSLPKGVVAGRLLSGYVERSLKRSTTEGFAVSVLRPLITDAGTKRALTTEEIAEKADATPLAARGCLIVLANDGLVRRLQGTPEKWEVAHDFVARLLQPLLRSWQKSAWERSRPYLVPVPLAVWLIAMLGLIAFYPALQEWKTARLAISRLVAREKYPLQPNEFFYEIELPMDQVALQSYAIHVQKVIFQYLTDGRQGRVQTSPTLEDQNILFVLSSKQEWKPRARREAPDSLEGDLLEDNTEFKFKSPEERTIRLACMPPSLADAIVTMAKQGELKQKVDLLADFHKRIFIKRVWCQNLIRTGDDNTSFSSLDLVGRTLSWSPVVETPLNWALTSLFMRFSYDYGFLQRTSDPETPPPDRPIEVKGVSSVTILNKHVGLTDAGIATTK